MDRPRIETEIHPVCYTVGAEHVTGWQEKSWRPAELRMNRRILVWQVL